MEEILALALIAGVGVLSVLLLLCLDAINSKSTSRIADDERGFKSP
jgi:hypothetical protein